MSESSTVTSGHETRSDKRSVVISMRDVTASSMRDQRAVVAEGINWQVEAGDFWAIAGLQGAGKSAFLMLAGGVMAPLKGRYEFMGEAMPIFSEERLAHRLKLGLVFDGGCLFNHLTVAENIALPLQYHGNLSAAEVEPQLATLLELTGMTQFARKRPSALGRNWQQRAALARALTLKPEVLLLDSPLSGLDQRHQNWWVAILSRLAAGHPYYEGNPITLVVTTDNLWAWRGRAKRFALLDERRFHVIGDWADVEQSRDLLVRELLAPTDTAANI
jgi:ABC-type transporter Mla maintaining outer membrane lipid asymmetry ATPase subunit MlaF